MNNFEDFGIEFQDKNNVYVKFQRMLCALPTDVLRQFEPLGIDLDFDMNNNETSLDEHDLNKISKHVFFSKATNMPVDGKHLTDEEMAKSAFGRAFQRY